MHARIVKGAAELLTRNGLNWTTKYPHIATAIGSVKCRQAYLDGELCAVLPDGTTSFAALQGHGDAPAELMYFAFDLLHLEGPASDAAAAAQTQGASSKPCCAMRRP